MKKLVLFGDSLFGQLGKHRILNMEAALPGYDVYNCAAGGWNTTDCVKKAPYIAKLEPDVVVISLGTNDAAPWKQVPLDAFIANIPKIFAAFDSPKLIYFLPPPVNEDKLPDAKKALSNEIMKKYYDAAKEVCDEHGVEVLNSWEVFMPILDSGGDYHLDDGTHLEDIAYDNINEELVKLLSKQT